MEFMDTVIRRQSCRAFAPGQVALEEIETILKAANAAPVSMGLYGNIHISVIQDEALIAALEEYTYRAFPDEGEHPAYQAPTLFSINCLKKEREAGAWADASAIAENILLAAADLGLGSIYLMGIPQVVRNDAGRISALCHGGRRASGGGVGEEKLHHKPNKHSIYMIFSHFHHK